MEWTFNAIHCLMWFLVMNCSLTYRFNRAVTYAVELLWFFIHMYLTTVTPFMSVFKWISAIFSLILFALFLFKDAWYRVLFTVAMVQLVVITNEMIGVNLYFPPEMLSGDIAIIPRSELALSYGIYLVLAAFLFFLLYLFLNRLRYNMGAKEWLLFALFPLSQNVLMFGWLDSLRFAEDELRMSVFLLVIVACVLADAGLFIAITRLTQRAQLAAENQRFAGLMEAQEAHYAALTAQYEDIRRMRHDIANHITAMRSMLEEGHSGEAAAYIAELSAQPWDSTLGLCANPVVDAFLHSRIESARAIGLEIRAQLSLRAGLGISNVDLIRAFGNLLDNAVEACAGVKGAVIKIKCAESKGYLIIITENPSSSGGGKTRKNRRVPELPRGVGTRVLAGLAEKYDGSLKQEEENGTFQSELILKIGDDL